MSATTLPAGRWSVDTTDSTMQLSTKAMTFMTSRATVSLHAGHVVVDDEGRIGEVRIEVAADSYDSGNDKRDTHVKSDDFLDASAFPTIAFTTADLSPSVDGPVEVRGTLEIKGDTHPVTVEISDVAIDGERASFHVSTVIDRKAVGVSKLPTAFVGRTTELTASVAAVRAPAA